MTLFGWDTSNWDYDRGTVDIARAVREGISFVTAKASEGTGFTDPFYAETARKAHAAGVLFGAYHVLHSGNIGSQVAHFVDVLDSRSPWWRTQPFIVQLDCERWPNDFPGAGDITAWCAELEREVPGVRPIIYASHGQYGDTLRGVHRPLWNANYGASDAAGGWHALYAGLVHPGWMPYSGQRPVILQYGSRLTIAGQPNCDANAFEGTMADLLALVAGPPAVPATHPLEVDMPTAIEREVPLGFAWKLDPAGKLVPIEGAHPCILTLALPPGTAAGLPWGAVYVSLGADLFGLPSPRFRVAINNGGGWSVDEAVTIQSGVRRNLGPGGALPAAEGGRGYVISIGRVQQSDNDPTANIPVAVLAELGNR